MIHHPFVEKIFFALMPLSTGALAIALGVIFFSSESLIPTELRVAQKPLIETPQIALDAFLQEKLTASSAIVYDITEQKILFAKNAEAAHPLASITKLMTALVAYDTVPHEKRIALLSHNPEQPEDTLLPLPDALAYLLVGSKNGEAERVAFVAESALALREGDTLIASPLLADTVASSSTSTLARFIKKMNERAAGLQMRDTRFLNPTGLDESESESGAQGSAHDVALLLSYLAKRTDLPFLEATSKPFFSAQAESGSEVTTENTNEIIGAIPGLMISKTGFTDLAGGNLAIVFDAGLNHPIAIVVLGSTLEGRFEDTQLLVEETLQAIQTQE